MSFSRKRESSPLSRLAGLILSVKIFETHLFFIAYYLSTELSKKLLRIAANKKLLLYFHFYFGTVLESFKTFDYKELIYTQSIGNLYYIGIF